MGVWERVKPKLVYGENIRHTLQFIETGAVEAGIVALSVADVPGVALRADRSEAPQAAQPGGGRGQAERAPELGLAFIQFLNGPEGRPIMKRYGFLLPGEF